MHGTASAVRVSESSEVINMANIEIREKAMQKNVRLWELAEKMGVSDAHFSRKMRSEFEAKDKQKALKYIDEIAEEHRRRHRMEAARADTLTQFNRYIDAVATKFGADNAMDLLLDSGVSRDELVQVYHFNPAAVDQIIERRNENG